MEIAIPIYCYTTEAGETVEELFPMGMAPPHITTEDGEYATRDLMAEKAGGSNHSANWPIECIGSGVSAHQAGELRAFFKKHGADCEVTGDGNPVYRDANHQKKMLKLRGFCNKASFGT